MKKNVITIMAAALMAQAASAQRPDYEWGQWLNVEMERPGMLERQMMDEMMAANIEYGVKAVNLDIYLRVGGEINGRDLRLLRTLLGGNGGLSYHLWRINDDDCLSVSRLDLSGATIVSTEGDDWYYRSTSDDATGYHSLDGSVASCCLFDACSNLSYLALPAGIRRIEPQSMMRYHVVELPAELEETDIQWLIDGPSGGQDTVVVSAMTPPASLHFTWNAGRQAYDEERIFTQTATCPQGTTDCQCCLSELERELLAMYRGKLADVVLVVPAGRREVYARTGIWQCFGTIVEDGVPTAIPSSALSPASSADGSARQYTLGGRPSSSLVAGPQAPVVAPDGRGHVRKLLRR